MSISTKQQQDTKHIVDRIIKDAAEKRGHEVAMQENLMNEMGNPEAGKYHRTPLDQIEDVIRQEVHTTTHGKSDQINVAHHINQHNGALGTKPLVAKVWDVWRFKTDGTNYRSPSIPEALQLGNANYWTLDMSLCMFVKDVTSGAFTLHETCYHTDHGNCHTHDLSNALCSFLEELGEFICSFPLTPNHYNFAAAMREPSDTFPGLMWALQNFKSSQLQVARLCGGPPLTERVGSPTHNGPFIDFNCPPLITKPSKGGRPVQMIITHEIETDFWKKGILGTTNSQTLLITVYYYISKVFGVRSKKDHQDLKMAQFTKGEDKQGIIKCLIIRALQVVAF